MVARDNPVTARTVGSLIIFMMHPLNDSEDRGAGYFFTVWSPLALGLGQQAVTKTNI